MTRDEAPREIEAATQENRPAQLEGADLEGADLEGVRLIQANLKGANLRGAHGIIRLPCSDPRGFPPTLCYSMPGGASTQGVTGSAPWRMPAPIGGRIMTEIGEPETDGWPRWTGWKSGWVKSRCKGSDSINGG